MMHLDQRRRMPIQLLRSEAFSDDVSSAYDVPSSLVSVSLRGYEGRFVEVEAAALDQTGVHEL